MEDGADGLFREAPRGRTFAAASLEQVATIVECTLHKDPPAATHWTLRSMAPGFDACAEPWRHPPSTASAEEHRDGSLKHSAASPSTVGRASSSTLTGFGNRHCRTADYVVGNWMVVAS